MDSTATKASVITDKKTTRGRKGRPKAGHPMMTPDQFRKALLILHPKHGRQRWFARTVGLNESHVRRYLSAARGIPAPMTLLITHLVLRKEEGLPIKIDVEEVIKRVEGE
jgi:hypothetical protein